MVIFSFTMFWAYLWGIETFFVHHFSIHTCLCFEPTYEELKLWYKQHLTFSFVMFWAYLWGIETRMIIKTPLPFHSVLSLPMRNWNNKSTASWLIRKRVLSLPMRNWNSYFIQAEREGFLCFEPTYEELKRTWLSWRIFKEEEFWAYLWGIETPMMFKCSFYSKSVLSLPMRNWNTREAIWG